MALCNTFTFPETALDLMESAECTGFAGVPSSFQLLLRNSTFPRRATPSLTENPAGGRQTAQRSNPGAGCCQTPGKSICDVRANRSNRSFILPAPGDAANQARFDWERHPWCGFRVIGEDGNPVKPGEVGEIIARGDNISPGYYNDPEASAEKFVDGALHTGDLATVDEDGYIFVVDRIADFIKSWGYRVSSQEVESCVLQLPDIVSAAAVGVPDLAAGEAIHVFVTLRAKAEITPDAIIAHCREKLARHMVPEVVTIIKSLPLNPTRESDQI